MQACVMLPSDFFDSFPSAPLFFYQSFYKVKPKHPFHGRSVRDFRALRSSLAAKNAMTLVLKGFGKRRTVSVALPLPQLLNVLQTSRNRTRRSPLTSDPTDP